MSKLTEDQIGTWTFQKTAETALWLLYQLTDRDMKRVIRAWENGDEFLEDDE